MTKKPLISIGIPVYNGEKFLSSAIDSILCQTFQDFELIISDNGSTDRTGEICEKYAANDERIRYYRYDQNRGAAWNFNNTFTLATGDYFKWAAADDICEPTYLESCLKANQSNPEAVLAFSRGDGIDDQGRPIKGLVLDDYLSLTSSDPRMRYHTLMNMFQRSGKRVSGWKGTYIFGLIRSDALRKTRLIGNYIGADATLLIELILLGKFCEVPDCLLFMRRHEQSFSWPDAETASKQEFYDPATKNRISLQSWTDLRKAASSIIRSPLSFRHKLDLLKSVAKEIFWRRKELWGELVSEIKRKQTRT
ncbi:MAG: glycosyltransferase family 2 protein [Gammaproteobacteria bacterium]|nr:glycosyltransferase family 2 protein [Gammaproteobacteria bacterium]MCF6259880.1 glycosyltransferase family 2 protein [Gammaproteobacteria bacterium]